MRLHYSHLTPEEYRLILNEVRRRSYVFSSHAFDRMAEKRVTKAQILAMISYCAIIEIHNDVTNEIRVLVRGKVNGNFVCAVVSLTNSLIVTTYWNKAGDFHKTLDTSLYCWTMPVQKILKGATS